MEERHSAVTKERRWQRSIGGNTDIILFLLCRTIMDLIPYSFAPLILFLVPYTLDLLPYYLSIANGAGGVGIFELFVFHVLYRSYRVNNKVIDVLYNLMYYYTGILFVVLLEG